MPNTGVVWGQAPACCGAPVAQRALAPPAAHLAATVLLTRAPRHPALLAALLRHRKVEDGCAMALQLEEDKALILRLVQQKMDRIAPNLSAAVRTPAQRHHLAGGAMPSRPVHSCSHACCVHDALVSNPPDALLPSLPSPSPTPSLLLPPAGGHRDCGAADGRGRRPGVAVQDARLQRAGAGRQAQEPGGLLLHRRAAAPGLHFCVGEPGGGRRAGLGYWGWAGAELVGSVSTRHRLPCAGSVR